MEFRTELKVSKATDQIDLTNPIITMGSCFADDIGTKLSENKFKNSINPLGTVYNPVSIHKLLEMAINANVPSDKGFIERDGMFYHYDFHSIWKAKSKSELADVLFKEITNLREVILSSRHLIVTYGTSWVYESKETKDVVANCHKIPQSNFTKFLLTQKRIIESFGGLHEKLKKVNPDLKIILTVSPVRHIKDTLELDSVSKSVLRLTCHTLSATYPEVTYFPSYEIMMDDLRDYRFYKPDMIHPSEQAIDYIWDKFIHSQMSANTINFIEEWKKINAALKHKPFNPESVAHQKFIKKTLKWLLDLKWKIDLEEEVKFLQGEINGSN